MVFYTIFNCVLLVYTRQNTQIFFKVWCFILPYHFITNYLIMFWLFNQAVFLLNSARCFFILKSVRFHKVLLTDWYYMASYPLYLFRVNIYWTRRISNGFLLYNLLFFILWCQPTYITYMFQFYWRSSLVSGIWLLNMLDID